jgi:hypothetical protein
MVTVALLAFTPAAAAVAAAAREQAPGAPLVVAGPHAGALAIEGATALDVPQAAGPAGALHGAIPAALGAGESADWVWILDGHALPQPGALQALLAASSFADLPDAAVLASKVVSPGGELHPDALPWPEIFEKEISTAACGHRMVSLRAARAGSVLVRRSAVERHGLPRPDFVSHGETLEWTARILRHEAGYLVPASLAIREDRDVPAVRRDLGNRARMLRGDSWRREEKLWFGFLLGQDAVRAAAGRASRRREAPAAPSWPASPGSG